MENKGKDDPWINVAVVVPEIDNELVNIAGILVGKDKPLIQYLPAAKKYDISQEEEYYSYQTLKALIGNIFNYGY
ncbi:hypothetical protein F8N00_13165 [Exiguobacterium sp. A1_3_1]|uniref:hypothetical protein n=1 Tax=Exiguobacterium sp. A1_3_1 TaxID=2651871 RepID=UPI003B8927C3